jgi:GABA(A) receptor-associated protein
LLPFALSTKDVERLRVKYPERVPVIMIRSPKIDPSFPPLERAKYLVPRSLTLGMFSYVVRKHMTLPPEKALFLFVENFLVPSTALMGDLHARFKSADEGLRIVYMSEATFGGSDSGLDRGVQNALP